MFINIFDEVTDFEVRIYQKQNSKYLENGTLFWELQYFWIKDVILSFKIGAKIADNKFKERKLKFIDKSHKTEYNI